MSGEIHQKRGVSASDAHDAYVAKQNAKIDAANAEKAQKEKLNADIRKYFAELGVDANKTKTITRMVDGKETNVEFGRDKNGNKVYIDTNTGKEVVVTETRGKNEFTTKDNLEKELMNRFGMTSKDFADKKIIAEFKHGKIVLTDVERGNQLSDAFLDQLENQHRMDLAAKRQPTPKELAYQEKEKQNVAAAEPAKTSVSGMTQEEYFNKMQEGAPQLAYQKEVEKKDDKAVAPEIKAGKAAGFSPDEVVDPSSMAIQEWMSVLTDVNKDLAVAPKADKPAAAEPENKADKKPLKRNLSGSNSKKFEAPTEFVVTGNTKRAIERRDKTYPPLVAMNDKRVSQLPGSDIYILTPPKPQGNGKLDPPNGFDQYEKVKVGNKEVLVRSKLKPEQKEEIIKSETQKYEQNKKNYETNVAKGKAFAKLLQKEQLPQLTDAQLADATKNLSAQYFKGFMKGVKSERLIGKNIMTSAYYSKTASPQAKKDFALKVMTAAQPWTKNANIEFKYNNITYTCESLLKEIKAKGLTQDLAFIASNILNQIK